ncbi:MAG: hypothetical protein M3O70_06730 [Actinomycetota bacterium]|nr:hypothetical protein [Actinomycetota bacterium]
MRALLRQAGAELFDLPGPDAERWAKRLSALEPGRTASRCPTVATR